MLNELRLCLDVSGTLKMSVLADECDCYPALLLFSTDLLYMETCGSNNPWGRNGRKSHLDLSELLKVCSCWWHTAVSSVSIIWSDGNVFAVMVSFWQLPWRCVITTCEYCISVFNTRPVCTISSSAWKQRPHFFAHLCWNVGRSTFSFWLYACGCLSVISKYLFCNQNRPNYLGCV